MSDDAFDPALRPSAKAIAARKEREAQAKAAEEAKVDASARVSQTAINEKLANYLEASTGGMIGLANTVGQMAGKSGDSLTVYTNEFKFVGQDQSKTANVNAKLVMGSSTPNDQLPISVSERKRLKNSQN